MILDPEPGLWGEGTDLRRHLGRNRGLRWLELRNKVATYRLFNRFAASRRSVRWEAIDALDPYSRLFAAEGYAYRHARPHALAGGLPVHLSLIAFHAGAGIRLAEEALASIEAGACEEHVLAAFYAACRRDSLSGFSGVTEEALGLVARMLYPHWMERLDQRVRTMDSGSCARFWHGAGRGIYFAPTNIPPFRAFPWKGVDMCLREPPHQTGKDNALSGFSFALTLVNLRHPEVLASFFQHHGDQTACLDGGQAAMAAWVLSNNGNEPTELLATSCRLPQTARVPWPFSGSRHVQVEDEERRRPERLFSARPGKDGLAAR